MTFFSLVFTCTLPLTGLWSFTSSNLMRCNSAGSDQISLYNLAYMDKRINPVTMFLRMAYGEKRNVASHRVETQA